MTSSTKPLIAFFGATGGVTLNTLSRSLKDGNRAIALARTPSKLTNLLTSAPHSIPTATLEANLTILKGSAHDVPSVKAVLAHPVDLIVFGLGGIGKLQPNLIRPVYLDQPTVCSEGTRTIIEALKQLLQEDPAKKTPFIVVISSTGIRDGAVGRTKKSDVPTLMAPLYHWMLQAPHADKQVMEKLVAEEDGKKDSVLSGWTVIRPTLLTDGECRGIDKIRVGWENKTGKGPGAAVGYTISRADVGNFVFEKFIKAQPEEWNGKIVTLTY